MRRGFFGIKEIMIAVFAIIVLLLIVYVLFKIIDPASTSAIGFGEQAARVIN
jgi:uncharacterized membrane protein